ncbi:MAG: tyrosine-type recombinase/integrase [Acidimicrobiia bacterium]
MTAIACVPHESAGLQAATTSTMVGRHLAWCEERNLRPVYVSLRGLRLRAMERELGVPVETATEQQLNVWAAGLVQRVAPGTRGDYLAHAREFYRWLVRERFRDDDPSVRLVRPRLRPGLPRPISEADLALALIDAPDRIRPWLLFGAFAGLRCCEIAMLRREDVRDDLDPPAIHVVDGKGGKSRIVPLHPVIAVELAQLPTRGWLFPHWDGSGHIKAHNITHGVARYFRSRGITATMHQLRHHFGTALYRQSHDLRLTQELLGHADPRTTAGYAAWSSDRAAAAVIALAVPTATLAAQPSPDQSLGTTATSADFDTERRIATKC